MTNLEQRRADLMRELKEIDRQIDQVKLEDWFSARQNAFDRSVLARFQEGQFLTNSNGRTWWCKEGVGLLEFCDSSEFDAVKRLEKAGFLKKGTR